MHTKMNSTVRFSRNIINQVKSFPSVLCTKWGELSFKVKIFARVFIYSCLGFFVIYSNPLGLSDLFEIKSQEAVTKILSPWYPFSAQGHNEKVVVVLVNAKSLDLISKLPAPQKIVQANEWPILYSDHANIFKTISSLSLPKQFFIDIEFHRIRNTDKSFPKLIKTLGVLKEENNIQFLHAVGSPGEKIGTEVNDQLTKVSTPTYNGWKGSFVALHQLNPKGKTLFSPALQMYSNLEPQKVIDTTMFDKEMFVFWDDTFDSKKYDMSSIKYKAEDSSSRILESLKHLFMQLLSIDDDSQTSYSQRVVHLDELQQMVNHGKEGEEKIKAIFDGAHVFYGADYIALGDKVFSPVHGYIPGVFYHAMAFENLLEFGDGYFKSYGKDLDLGLWLLLVFLFSVSLVGKEKVSFVRKHHAITVSLIVGIYIFIILLMVIYQRIAPANLVALLGLVGLTLWIYAKEKECSQKPRITWELRSNLKRKK